MTKTALITGASGGIGRAVARRLAQQFNIVIGYNTNESDASKLEKSIIDSGGEACCFKADISNPADANALAEFALSRYGKIDVLVSCAGVSLGALVTETTNEQWKKIFDVNVSGVFYICRAVLPSMISRRQGHIINISSIWGMAGASCEAAYSASKAAVIGFTKALAKEVAPSNILVNCVAPGFIDTDMNSSLSGGDRQSFIDNTPLGRAGIPDDVAGAVAYLVSDNFTTGQVLSPNGGIVI